MKTRLLVFVTMIYLTAFIAFPQTKPRIAVIPFQAVGVSENEARTATSLFETSLVKTGVFDVMERNQINMVLSEQAFSISGCSDEACAVQIGKLLSAEQIILGDIALTGETYFANAKIIDVEKGRNLRAETVNFGSLKDLADQMNLLAFMLAGLTVDPAAGGQAVIAKDFGEVLVTTVPDGAEVFLNGMKRGTSTLLLDKVPAGSVVIEARSDNLYARGDLQVKGGDFLEISLELKVTLGRLFIRADEKDVDVYFDGQPLGNLGVGLFKDLPAGMHTLELKGSGLYYKGEVTLSEGETAQAEVWLTRTGMLVYTIPADVEALLKGPDVSPRTLTGSGSIDTLPIGSYTVELSGEHITAKKDNLTVRRGETVDYVPAVEYTAAYKAEMTRLSYHNRFDALKNRYDRNDVDDELIRQIDAFRIELVGEEAALDLAGLINECDELAERVYVFLTEKEERTVKDRLQNIDKKITGMTGLDRYRENIKAITDVKTTIGALAYSKTDFGPELARLEQANHKGAIKLIDGDIEGLEYERKLRIEKILPTKRLAWTSLISGLILDTGAYVFGILANEAYKNYTAGETTDVITAARTRAEAFSVAAWAGGGTGGLLTILGLIGIGTKADTAPVDAEIAKLMKEKAEIENKLRQINPAG